MNIVIALMVAICLVFGLVFFVTVVDIGSITSSVPGFNEMMGLFSGLLFVIGIGIILIVFAHKAKGG